MKTLILYASKYGATKALAERIAEKLPGAFAANVHDGAADLAAYDAVILGTPIYMGRPRKEMKEFAQKNLAALLQKKTGLFLCCLQDENDSVSRQFQVAFPKELRDHASVLAALGGVLDKEKLKAFDGLIMRIVSANLPSKDKALSTVSEERIDRLVELMTATPLP